MSLQAAAVLLHGALLWCIALPQLCCDALPVWTGSPQHTGWLGHACVSHCLCQACCVGYEALQCHPLRCQVIEAGCWCHVTSR